MCIGIFCTFFSCDMSENAVRRDLSYIESNFNGIVIDKVKYNRSMHIVVKTDSIDKLQTPSISSYLFNSVQVADSLIKIKNSNYCNIYKNEVFLDSVCYVNISYKHREHELWPKEWSDKWMECATERAKKAYQQSLLKAKHRNSK